MQKRNDSILTRRDLVLALTEARTVAERALASAPEYVRGYQDGIAVAIEIVRALDNMDRAISHQRIERR
jgi:hypothetical protein